MNNVMDLASSWQGYVQAYVAPNQRYYQYHQRPREMTAADLGLHKSRCEYSMEQLCLWWDHIAATRLFKPDAPYAFWLGADA